MFIQGTVFDPSSAGTPDGQSPNVNMGRANEVIVAQLHGNYFEQCYRGNVFYASTATTGVAIQIASSTAPTFTIWNPAGSGKLCVPIVTLIGWTATTGALGGFIWQITTNAGNSISSTAPFVAFGTGTPLNANLGAGKVSQMRIATGGTTTLVAASTFYRAAGLTTTLTTAGVTGNPGWVWRDEWDGQCVLPPGNALHLLGSTAVANTCCVTTAYVEVPL